MKARQSKLDPYSKELASWLAPQPEGEGLTLAKARDRLKENHGLSVDISRISTWWAAYQKAELERQLFAKIADGSRVVAKVREAATDSPPSLAPLLKLLETYTAQLALHGSVDKNAEILPGLIRTAILGGRLALDQSKFEFLQARARKADEAETVTRDTTLTEEEKQARYRTIFGLA